MKKKKIMKKTIVLLLLASALCTVAVGCGNENSAEESKVVSDSSSVSSGLQPSESGLVYSNLVDAASQKEVVAQLESHGVTKAQTDQLLSWVKDFNGRVSSGSLPEGFSPMGKTGVDYSNVSVKEKEQTDGELLSEVNCRFTSYLLLKNRIQTNGKQEEKDTFLMFDIEALDTENLFPLNEAEKQNFISLFNWVPVKGENTLEGHIAKIQQAWKDREIQISGEGISLINVYLHSELEDVRFVGHSGVLMETEDGLLFVEKYGPLFPFQATKFHNREELKAYLLSRADLYGEATELEPIVMENNQPL